MGLFISLIFLIGSDAVGHFLSHIFDVAHFQRQVLLGSVTNLHRIASVLLFITHCFGVRFRTIDRSKHKPWVFAESIQF